MGAWGPATADGEVLHLRALDWKRDALVNEFPAITIYEPTEEGSIPFANVGWLGLIGSLTGMNKAGISIGEKQYIDLLGEDAEWTYRGTPWLWVLRDTIQFSANLEEAEQFLTDARRTIMIHGGLGSAADHTFRGFDYT